MIKNTIKIFYIYARRDKRLRDELEEHLGPLKRSGQITTWYDREIQPGKDWKREIENQLDSADIILLLLSSHFVNSDYCYGQEMQRALRRQAEGDVCIIPVILRPVVNWHELPIGKLQALPTDGKPVSKWRPREDAFEDIARGIHRVVIDYQQREAIQESSQHTDSISSLELQASSVPPSPSKAEKEALFAGGPLVDWGDALAVPTFYGREQELALLEQWTVRERCRVVSVLGMVALVSRHSQST